MSRLRRSTSKYLIRGVITSGGRYPANFESISHNSISCRDFHKCHEQSVSEFIILKWATLWQTSIKVWANQIERMVNNNIANAHVHRLRVENVHWFDCKMRRARVCYIITDRCRRCSFRVKLFSFNFSSGRISFAWLRASARFIYSGESGRARRDGKIARTHLLKIYTRRAKISVNLCATANQSVALAKIRDSRTCAPLTHTHSTAITVSQFRRLLFLLFVQYWKSNGSSSRPRGKWSNEAISKP